MRRNQLHPKRGRELFRRDVWSIGIVDQSISSFLRPHFRPRVAWLPIAVERDKFFADPFGLKRGETLYVLCEEFDYGTSKGKIVCIEITEGLASGPRTVIEPPFHVSYPYVFEYGSDVYCVPETRQAGEITLYRAELFPYKWREVATLVSNFSGVDPTVFQYQDRWWLTCADGTGSMLRLLVWHSSNPLGPWHPHAQNPVKSETRSSRPAGTPFMHDGHLYRPAQDCSKTYGGRVVLNRVVTLTPTEFEEEGAAFVDPFSNAPFPDGLHTLSAVGDITLIDSKRTVFSRSAMKHTVISAVAAIRSGTIYRSLR